MLERDKHDDVRAYIVWEPVLSGDSLAAAEESSKAFTDKRIKQYWDGGRTLGLGLAKTLDIGATTERGLAWDVYLLYDKTARWSAPGPSPAFWMHQLEGVPAAKAPLLETSALATHLGEIESRR